MIRRRTTARGLVLASSLALAGAAVAATDGATGRVPQLVFPVVGPAAYTNDFGDARPQGRHEGNDIAAPRKAIAVAAEAGRVDMHVNARAGCMLYLYGHSGTTYLYVHLNNDLGKGNDNRGKCKPGVAFAPGLQDGAEVAAGDPVGFVGDSGDADGGRPHLHFEVHPNDGPAANPFKHLNRARRLLFVAPAGETVTLSLTGTVVEASIESLTLRVKTLQIFPGLKHVKVERPLTISLPPTAQIDTGAGLLEAPGPQLGEAKGKSAIVLTEPALATLDVRLGKALAAARVVLRS